MKEMKKTFLALTAAVMVLFASAALPAAADEDYTSDAGYVEDTGDTVPEPIAAQDEQPVSQPEAAPVSAPSNESTAKRSGVSFGTVFLLFLLGILINAGVSFVIANRFYALSKKDSHLQAEIRALRRDITEKFGGSITEIKEKSAAVTNSNKNYSRPGGITYKQDQPSGQKPQKTEPVPEQKPQETEEPTEISKRWNIDVEAEADPEVTIRTSRRGGTRRAAGRGKAKAPAPRKEETYHEDDQFDADEGVSESVKDKAKKFLGDIFPFEDE